MNSLARLVCSRVRAEIFRVLSGVKAGELHLREIQRCETFALKECAEMHVTAQSKIAEIGAYINRVVA